VVRIPIALNKALNTSCPISSVESFAPLCRFSLSVCEHGTPRVPSGIHLLTPPPNTRFIHQPDLSPPNALKNYNIASALWTSLFFSPPPLLKFYQVRQLRCLPPATSPVGALFTVGRSPKVKFSMNPPVTQTPERKKLMQ